MIDGTVYLEKTANNRNIKRWSIGRCHHREDTLYKAVHMVTPLLSGVSRVSGKLSNGCSHYSSRNYREYALIVMARSTEQVPNYQRPSGTGSRQHRRRPSGTNLLCLSNGSCIRSVWTWWRCHWFVSYNFYYDVKQHRFDMKWKNRPIPEWFVYVNTNETV